MGIFDGVFFDYWFDLHDVLGGHRTLEAQQEARVNILRAVREVVHPDFLLMGNANYTRLPLSAPYMNGIGMESVIPGHLQFYPIRQILDIEETLRWAEDNMRQPTINCLQPTLPYLVHNPGVFDTPRQHQQVRLFMAMALTHSNASIQYQHFWYDFWDFKLGRPVSPKSQKAEGNGGCFIREFENGWAVYNRSSTAHVIQLPDITAAVSTGERDFIHEVASMDGEIFLRSHPTSVSHGNKLTTLWGEMKRSQ